MASGSQNMTTYNARTVTGSNSAASPAGALLLSYFQIVMKELVHPGALNMIR